MIDSGTCFLIFEFETHHMIKHNLSNFLLKAMLSLPVNAIALSEQKIFEPSALNTQRSAYIVMKGFRNTFSLLTASVEIVSNPHEKRALLLTINVVVSNGIDSEVLSRY